MPFDVEEKKQMGINTNLLDCEEEGELTRPHRFAYDSILQPSVTDPLPERTQQEMDFGSARGNTARPRPAFASFVAAVPHTERERQNDSDSLRIDFKDDLDDQVSQRLEKMVLPARTHSHFVALNDNNEDMLLEGINGDDGENKLNEMLLDEEPDLERDEEDELLI